MFERILVPVDVSEKSLTALRRAVEIARQAGPGVATVTLLHVIETIQGIEFGDLEDFYRELENKARRVMDDWCREVGSDAVRIDRLVLYGRRTAEVLRVAGDRASDLIVVTSHRVDAEHPGGSLGTISHQIGMLAGCSVLLLR
jgi:nucleotide-binding universal stress UspA family protein